MSQCQFPGRLFGFNAGSPAVAFKHCNTNEKSSRSTCRINGGRHPRPCCVTRNFPATPYYGLHGYGIYLDIFNRYISGAAIVLVILYRIYLLKELVRKFRHLPGNLILLVLNSLVFILAGTTFYQVFFVGVVFWECRQMRTEPQSKSRKPFIGVGKL